MKLQGVATSGSLLLLARLRDKSRIGVGADVVVKVEDVRYMSLAAQTYGCTRKGTLLFSVPAGVVTVTVPVVAPEGTVVVISELETTVNAAAVP
jgi:hypothetical protein